ncbi:4Fe-4S dicluster domain-containing protein [Paenibacillus peoriae]|uniref:4Fe-4S dicluster domain-containing protein n=1 Tax=Paenibacillus peoriae TaxID=59893 RepID=UPI00026C62F2|nr:4Fe-4S dicluster domain-containing protein [Paenibacillus peoriae]MEC0181891.1 4Fe-4S dicluster domain-containing protein [Paenibacillus peoriae]
MSGARNTLHRSTSRMGAADRTNAVASSFVVADGGQCIGCKACELACFAVHSRAGGVGASVGTVSVPVVPKVYVVRAGDAYVPVQCRHCENAPCAHACPVQAIRQEDGVVMIDEERCIGCTSCVLACPFGAIEVSPVYRAGHVVTQSGLTRHANRAALPRTAASKCDLCAETADGQPACVEACPNQVLRLAKGAVDSPPERRREVFFPRL